MKQKLTIKIRLKKGEKHFLIKPDIEYKAEEHGNNYYRVHDNDLQGMIVPKSIFEEINI